MIRYSQIRKSECQNREARILSAPLFALCINDLKNNLKSFEFGGVILMVKRNYYVGAADDLVSFEEPAVKF